MEKRAITLEKENAVVQHSRWETVQRVLREKQKEHNKKWETEVTVQMIQAQIFK